MELSNIEQLLWEKKLDKDYHFQQLSTKQQAEMYRFLRSMELDYTRIPVKFPLNKISTDEKSFQIRRHAYSEKSFNKYIGSVLSGRFDPNLLSNTLLRPKPQQDTGYVLSGHSRFHAQLALTNPTYIHPGTDLPLPDHPQVQKIQHDRGFDFHYLSSFLYLGNDSSYAKNLSAISNTLGTPEDQIDRAMFYQSQRELHQISDSQLGEEFKILEGSNRNNLINLSYLHPQGITMQTLSSFNESSEDFKKLFKIAVWIGNTRKKYIDFTSYHENELFERLFKKEAFNSTYRRREDFFQALEDHMKQYGFDPAKPLNIEKLTITHPYMQEYNKKLNELQQKISDLRSEERQLLTKAVKHATDLSRQQVIQIVENINDPRELIQNQKLTLEVIYEIIQQIPGIEGVISTNDLHKIRILLAVQLINREQFKQKRTDYLDAAKRLPSLFD